MSSQAKEIATKLIKCFKRGNKILICGNGGSAQQANHFAAELVHEGLPAISLTSDISVVTAIANDEGYQFIFANQILALGKKGDILITLSTSPLGKSANVWWAFETARNLDIENIFFPQEGNVARCQEYQLGLIHKIKEILNDN